MSRMNYIEKRAIKLIKEIISKLKLDLDGYTVLTEVGSNFYLHMPIIASLAGAKKVYAIAKDTSYGNADDVRNECLKMLNMIGIQNVVFSSNIIPDNFVQEANIITNSGNLRPINSELYSKVNKTVVVPLMYEKWELRKEDVDVDWCRQNGIKVAGTWEEHPDINVFGSSGQLAIKLAHEAGYEVYDNNIIVWSNDHFGDVISRAFLQAGASNVITTIEYSDLIENINECDFIFICDYDETRTYFGDNGFIDIEELIKINNAFGIVHLYGEVNNDILNEKGVNVYPNKRGKAKYMTQTLGYVGLKPIINLQAAGLKVAQEMLNNQYSSLSQLI